MIVLTRSANALPLIAEGALAGEPLWLLSSLGYEGLGEPPGSSPGAPAAVGPSGPGGRSRRRAVITALARVDEERVAAHGMAHGLSQIIAIEIALGLRKK